MAREQLASRAAPEPQSAGSRQAGGREGGVQPGLAAAEAPDFAFALASNPFGHYCVPESLSETAEAGALAGAEVAEPATVALIRRKLGGGDLITGCTGIGSFLPAFHEALAPSAMIHAFEPDETAHAAAGFTATLNELERVCLHQAVAGKKDRAIRAARLMEGEPEGEAAQERIPMRRLDTLVPQGRYVSIIHLNSHGLEMAAILGGKRIVHDCAPMMVMKMPDEKTRRFFLSCLEAHFPEMDYRFAGQMDGNGIFVALNRV